MNGLPAITGWLWVKEGFAIFRQRPAQLSMLFLSYMFIMLGIGIIPVIGQLAPLLLAPTFSMIFMTACAQIAQGSGLNVPQLRASFESPVAKRLLMLGSLYIFAALISFGISWLIDGGLFWQLLSGQRDVQATTGQKFRVLLTIISLAVLYIPVFWFSAPLIMWQKMSVGKAIFYSFFSVIRNLKACLVFFLGWLLIGVVLPSFLSIFLSALIGMPVASMVMMFLLSIVLTVVMYCSFYPTYVHVFGKPELPPTTPA